MAVDAIFCRTPAGGRLKEKRHEGTEGVHPGGRVGSAGPGRLQPPGHRLGDGPRRDRQRRQFLGRVAGPRPTARGRLRRRALPGPSPADHRPPGEVGAVRHVAGGKDRPDGRVRHLLRQFHHEGQRAPGHPGHEVPRRSPRRRHGTGPGARHLLPGPRGPRRHLGPGPGVPRRAGHRRGNPRPGAQHGAGPLRERPAAPGVGPQPGNLRRGPVVPGHDGDRLHPRHPGPGPGLREALRRQQHRGHAPDQQRGDGRADAAGGLRPALRDDREGGGRRLRDGGPTTSSTAPTAAKTPRCCGTC